MYSIITFLTGFSRKMIEDEQGSFIFLCIVVFFMGYIAAILNISLASMVAPSELLIGAFVFGSMVNNVIIDLLRMLFLAIIEN